MSSTNSYVWNCVNSCTLYLAFSLVSAEAYSFEWWNFYFIITELYQIEFLVRILKYLQFATIITKVANFMLRVKDIRCLNLTIHWKKVGEDNERRAGPDKDTLHPYKIYNNIRKLHDHSPTKRMSGYTPPQWIYTFGLFFITV